ncbi:MAG TPA: ATP-binding protein [Sphingobacteriaceae bacterium]|nr:ATP-binding protein [Sphingobacteriaceae bacterium]
MKLSTKIFLGSALVIALSALGSYTNYLLSKKVNINTEFLANSEGIIRNSSRLHNQILEMQTAFRGFLLTEDESFLDSYKEGIIMVPQLILEERKLINNSQIELLDTIVALHHQWMSYSNSLVEAKKKSVESIVKLRSYQDLFNQTLRQKVGKKLNDKISTKFKEFNTYEYKVRQSRREMLQASIERTHIISLTSISLTILICIISTVLIVRSIAKRISFMVEMAGNIAQGRFYQVEDEKSDELSSLSASLNIMSVNLQRNIRELESRNMELNQFASVVSHDLKAPLRGIHNVISWIEEDLGSTLSEQLRKYLNIIPERIARMENLINGLLDYTRISRDKPLKEIVNVQELVETIVDSIVPRNYDVSVENLPTFSTEKIRLEQVFSNLISNSVKYSKSNTGKIKVTCRESADKYEFEVRDDGIGIDPQFHEKIFVIFQTLRDKHSVESTGIGLSIVKKILEEYNGNIRVKSSLGEGSSFVFTWPKN